MPSPRSARPPIIRRGERGQRLEPNQNWLTVREVATELQVHEETVRRWIRSGELPAIEIGGPRTIYRIRPAALGAFMRQRTHGHASEVVTDEPDVLESRGGTDFRQLIEQLPMITFALAGRRGERRGSLLYISPEVEQVFGVPAEEWYENLDEVWKTLMSEEQYERVVELSERMRATQEHYSLDIRMHNRRTGAPVWVSLDMELDQSDLSGREVWYGLMVDITERKRLEEQLRAHVKTLHELTRSLAGVKDYETAVFEVLRALPKAVPTHIARMRAIGVGGRVVTTYTLTWEGPAAPLPGDLQVERGRLPRNCLARQVLERKEALRVADLQGDRRLSGEHEVIQAGACSALAVPVEGESRMTGVLEVFDTDVGAFGTGDVDFLMAASGIMSLALANRGERWLTVPEVAELLDVQPETVRRWIRGGELAAAMPGGVRAGYRVDASQLDAFIGRRHSGRRPVR